MKKRTIWWLGAIVISFIFITSCLPWGKKKDEAGLYEKGKEGKWVYSERQQSSPGEEKRAVTYSKKPYESEDGKNTETDRPQPISTYYFGGRLKYKVVILEFHNIAKEERRLEEIVTQELARQLEESGAVVLVDMELVKKHLGRNDQQYLLEPSALWRLKTLLGVQGVVTGVITDVLMGSGKDRSVNEAMAVAKIDAKVLDTETGNIIKSVKGENPIYTSRTVGEFSSDKALLKAVNFSLNEVKEGIIRGLSSLEWSSSIASIEGDKIFVNAGKSSGLKIGDILEVYSPGKEVRHPVTNVSLGRIPGKMKGTVKIGQFFGIDASEALAISTSDILNTGDIVRLAK